MPDVKIGGKDYTFKKGNLRAYVEARRKAAIFDSLPQLKLGYKMVDGVPVLMTVEEDEKILNDILAGWKDFCGTAIEGDVTESPTLEELEATVKAFFTIAGRVL